MLKCLFQTLLIDHLLETPGASLIAGNAIQGFSEYLMAFGTSEPTDAEDQIDFALKTSHITNATIIVLVNILAHIPAARTDATVKVNATVESGYLSRLVNGI
jgi:hypothetical protein